MCVYVPYEHAASGPEFIILNSVTSNTLYTNEIISLEPANEIFECIHSGLLSLCKGHYRLTAGLNSCAENI